MADCARRPGGPRNHRSGCLPRDVRAQRGVRRRDPARLAPFLGPEGTPSPVDEFRRLTRDIYVPTNDPGYCQVAIRDPESADFEVARSGAAGEGFAVDVLYGDAEGSQRVVSRFVISHGPPGQGDLDQDWVMLVSRHWNLDLPDPR